mgnify:CR=1 FL=1
MVKCLILFLIGINLLIISETGLNRLIENIIYKFKIKKF